MALDTASAAELRAAIEENDKLRERELAQELGVTEGQLVAACVGRGVTRIESHPNVLIPAIEPLGEVMALTRNDSAVHEKVGRYTDYRPGDHASMIFTRDIDLRFFPKHWVSAFAVTRETPRGLKRSIQIFDAAGDAVHKIHLREASDLASWDRLTVDLALEEQSDTLSVSSRVPPEGAKLREDKRDILLEEWRKLSDTHQFLRLCSKLKMNRLGAYRIAGEPYARRLTNAAADDMLKAVHEAGIDFMFFIGNRGCIQIHTGPILQLKPMGPWQNILDPGFDMHLRLDHVAEVYAVEKPTQRGVALSLEAFDANGSLIFQAFPVAREGNDTREAWKAILDGLKAFPPEGTA